MAQPSELVHTHFLIRLEMLGDGNILRVSLTYKRTAKFSEKIHRNFPWAVVFAKEFRRFIYNGPPFNPIAWQGK